MCQCLRWAKGETGSLVSRARSLEHPPPPRNHKEVTFPTLTLSLFLLLGASGALYSICMMVNIVPHVSVEPYSLREPEMCSFSFAFDTAWYLKPPWFTKIVTSLQSRRPRRYLHCYSLNSEFVRTAVECVFIWGWVRRDWFCLLLDCCLSVSSTTDRDSLLFIWTPAQTFDLSKWVANPSPSYRGALVAIPSMLPPSGLKGVLHQFCTSRSD